jgi:hypothetical protein
MSRIRGRFTLGLLEEVTLLNGESEIIIRVFCCAGLLQYAVHSVTIDVFLFSDLGDYHILVSLITIE